jgi:diguanylate cyclase (GGDEF)-like protein
MYDEIGLDWQEWGALLKVPTRLTAKAVEIEERARAASSQDDAKPPADTSMRILAVDDDPVSLKLLVSHLKKAGHKVFTARDGKEALAVALEQDPQMVITDWMMPEIDGLELCKRLRSTEAGRNLYILILTGRTEEDRIVEAFEAGADDYIVKPWSSKLLLARISPGIRVIQLQEENQRHLSAIEVKNAELGVEKRRLREAAMTDALTSLPNRRYAMKRLEKEWATSTRSMVQLSLILLDIDHFKSVNDNHGHDIGDEVLRATARIIDRAMRRGDTCARLGGEEFLVICPGTDAEGAKNLAERIRKAVEMNEVHVGTYHDKVTVSLGVACRSFEADSIGGLLKAADEAVYVAKRMGRNRVALAPPKEDKRTAS